MAKKQRQYTATDGKLFLIPKPATKGKFTVTSPFIPGMASEAETLEEAFATARDAVAALKATGRQVAKRGRPTVAKPSKRKAAKRV